MKRGLTARRFVFDTTENLIKPLKDLFKKALGADSYDFKFELIGEYNNSGCIAPLR